MADEKKNIDIDVNTYDKTGPGLQKARKALNAFDKSIEKTKDRLSKMMQGEYEIVLKGLDQISPLVSKVKSSLAGFAGGRPYRVTLNAIDRASTKIKEIKATLVDLTSRAWTVTVRAKQALGSKVGGAVNNGLAAVTGMGGSMLAGAGIAYGGYDTVKTAMDFESQMSTVAAISGAGAEDMQKLTEKAKEMGAITSFSASDAGKAFEYMAMAGWKTGDMLGGIEGIMNLAAASGEDLGRVSDIVTDALTAFGLSAKDSAQFADVLAAASSNSNTNVAMMGDTFKYVAPVAGALKFSVEDTALAIGLMANAGIKGSEAGTAMRATFTRMVSPTKDSAAAMAALGLEVQNADGSMKPLRTILKDIRQGFLGMTDAQKAETAAMLAGQEGMSGLLSIANASEADFNKLAVAIDGSEGAAKRMADIRLDNLKGDVEQLGGAWETFQLTLMKGSASDGLRVFVQSVTEILDKFTQSIKDGFDFGDIVSLTEDIIDRLIDKFLKLDGVGSVLAGGALAMGLKSIYGLTKKVYGGAKDVLYGISGKSGMGEAAASAIGKEMIVNAQTVIVNGKSVGGSPGSTGSKGGGMVDQYGNPIGSSKAPSKAPVPEPPVKGGLWGKLSKFGKGAGKLASKAALPLMAAMGAYELWNAKDGEKASTAGNVGGGLVGGWAGAKAGAALGGAVGSVVPGAGTAVGAAVGGVAGGIGGYLLGSDLGEELGRMIGEVDWSGKFQSLKDGLGSAVNDGMNIAVGVLDVIGLWEPLKQGAAEASSAIQNNLEWARNSISEKYSDLSNWFDENAWKPLSERTGNAAKEISDKFNEGKGWITSHWGDLTSWFDKEIWGPLSTKASSVFSSISSYISGAVDKVGEWRAHGESVRKTGSADASESEKPDRPFAWGGIMTVPHRGLVAEAGPEAIVPLGVGRRDRGLDIWQKAGQMLGVDMSAGDTAIPFLPSIATPENNMSTAPSAITISVTSTPTFEISGGQGVDAESIMAVVRANAREMADDIGDEVAEKLAGIFGNQPLKVG